MTRRPIAEQHPGRRRADDETQALIAARALVDRMTVLYRDLERLTGAPIALHRALAFIGGEPGIQASTLAEVLGIQRSAVSHVLKALVGRGWIERIRSIDDQRSVKLFVTPDGKSVLDATSGKAAGTLRHCVRRLTDEELDGLRRGLAAILKHLPEPTRTRVKSGAARIATESTRRRGARARKKSP